jgi:peroxiredoxin
LRVTAVGLGQPKHAVNICGRIAPSLECLVDSEETAYALYGLGKGSFLQLVGPAVLAAGARAAAQGHKQGQTTGSGSMLPGTFIIDQAGIIRYAYYSEHAGDHPPIDALLKTVI